MSELIFKSVRDNAEEKEKEKHTRVKQRVHDMNFK